MTKKSAPAATIQSKIDQLEMDIFSQKVKLAELRRKAKPRPIADQKVKGAGGKSFLLSKLFGKKGEMILVHNMGSDCPYCTLWADGFNGHLHDLTSKAAFLIESPETPAQQARLKKSRRWNFEMISTQGSKLREELGFINSEGDLIPGISVLTRNKKGEIFQVSRTQFGPGDNYCAIWDIFDLLPQGAGEWEPNFRKPV